MSSEDDGDGLPDAVVDEAERLTRLAREVEQRVPERSEPRVAESAATRDVSDDAEAAAYRADREALLTEHGYAARVREDSDGDVLVLYPAAWLEDGTVQVDRVEDVSRGVEVPLSGPGEGRDWEAVEAHNREIAETVAAAHGEPHGETAHALADFASNHYAKRLESLTPAERREFREEYLPRNGWPSEAQRDVVAESLRLTLAAGDAPVTDEMHR